MSAETPHRSSSQNRTSGGPTVVLPQQVTDPTILDNVAGFISDVVPAAYNNPCDTKDQIQWAHFEQLEVDESTFSNDFEKISSPPLLLVLGYATGVQVWSIPANGDAVEILSWRHGTVRVLKFLPAPYRVGCGVDLDMYSAQRPLIALCDSATPGPQYCSLNFISLKTGEQVKLFKFKNPVLDVLANRRSIVVSFTEKIAVFDAFTLEDRLTVTTCYLSPGINANPVALGTSWIAYAENKLLPSRKSGGGNEGEGVQSYTATVIHAAKSLGRGLRELGETVASSLTGNSPYKPSTLSSSAPLGSSNSSDAPQKGIVTVLNIEGQGSDNSENGSHPDAIVAHFIAHTEAIVSLLFDPSGFLLLTADKRGHDFHLFKIHPHPISSSMASVHHLYILHRGDTTARVQDMCFSPDSRWVTVSSLRGTTHVFPVTPYGGNVGTRTHTTPHVVNRMSRFHRSAGLTAEGRSNSPVTLVETPSNSNLPYLNPRLPPYPHPTVVNALAQIRQPVYVQNTTNTHRPSSGRQRLSSSSEDSMQVALRVSSCFASPRAWIDSPTQSRETTHSKQQTKSVEALFVASCHGSLIQYDLDPHAVAVPKEKLCDDTPIELSVCAKAQWVLQRQPNTSDISLPLPETTLNLIYQEVPTHKAKNDEHDDRWLSQVEILTHAGPHRRLWMGPQFTFKTYSNTSGAPLNILESQAIDIGKSKPVNMPSSSAYPVLIECGSLSSCEPSPKLIDNLHRHFDDIGGPGESQLKEDLAEAMLESPGVREGGGRCVIVSMKPQSSGIAKVVNPLGTVVTVHTDDENEVEVFEDAVIHENCDEALFRPVVASKAVVLADPKIKTNSLPNHKTTIIETKKPVNSPLIGTKGNLNKDLTPNYIINDMKKCANDESSLNSNSKSMVKPGIKTKPLIEMVTKAELNTSIKSSKESDNIKLMETKKCNLPAKQVSRKMTTNFKKQTDHRNSSKADEPILPKLTPIKHDIVMLEHAFAAVEITPCIQPSKPIIQNFSDSEFPDSFMSDVDSFKHILEMAPPPPLDNSILETRTILKTPDLADDIYETILLPVKKSSNKNKESVKPVRRFDEDSLIKSDDELIDDIIKIEKMGDVLLDNELINPVVPENTKRKPLSSINDKYQGLDTSTVISSSSDDKIQEDKQMSKKRRKPKTKLGVKITKDVPEILDLNQEEPSVEVTLPPPKRSWSSIASSTPAVSNISDPDSPKELIDILEYDSYKKDIFVSNKPSYKRPIKDSLIDAKDSDSACDDDISTSKIEEKMVGKGKDTLKINDVDTILLKVDKFDEEKQENSSSQTETTESDDSSKVPIETVAMDTEEDGCHGEIVKTSTIQIVSKSKKKPKKKKR